MSDSRPCPDCDSPSRLVLPDRRGFLSTLGAAAAGIAVGRSIPVFAEPKADSAASPPETLVKTLFGTLTDAQKKEVCFAWDHVDEKRGLLRTAVSNNWHITKPTVDGAFYTADQKDIIHAIFKGLFHPDWYPKLIKQLKDDNGGKAWGANQNIAIFGTPGDGKFEFVMTGRHMTIRADGNSTDHVAWGGPIFHGHAASGFNEKVHHPDNIFWHQALLANKVYQMLDGKQREASLVTERPKESSVRFRGAEGKIPGIVCSELSADQKTHLTKVLDALIEPYRQSDRDEILACLKKQGGLDKCRLAFYKDGDLGDDGEWDNWRLEGPSFVWYFRGEPHVHIWVNVADDPSVATNAKEL